MQKTKIRPQVAFAIISILLVLSFASGSTAPVLANSLISPNIQSQGEATDYTVSLPVLLKQKHSSIFGSEIFPGYVNDIIEQTVAANVSWVRYLGISWAQVEATQGVRDWYYLNGDLKKIKTISDNGLTPIVIFYNAPMWARVPEHNQYNCAAIQETALDDFASFVGEAVSRYSQPPYNIKFWEVWNEPDVSPESLPPPGGYKSVFGCWGDPDDANFGGGYFAEMLKKVYPAIKNADPFAKVVLGGLLLGCDPVNPPNGSDCKASSFLNGILSNGGGSYFDIVAYHAYMYWSLVRSDWDLAQPFWSQRGGAIAGKLAFIKEVLAQNNVSKPILINEINLSCTNPPLCPGAQFEDDKANAVLRAFVRVWKNGLVGASWYTMNAPGWRDSNLLDTTFNPLPAYSTFKFLSTLLKTAAYERQLSTSPIEGYQFSNLNRIYQVYWSINSTSTTIDLPSGTTFVFDKYGTDITPNGSKITVSFDPIIIQINK